jgi:hypothetical protein
MSAMTKSRSNYRTAAAIRDEIAERESERQDLEDEICALEDELEEAKNLARPTPAQLAAMFGAPYNWPTEGEITDLMEQHGDIEAWPAEAAA